MNILVCGARGCVGSAVVHALRWRGHRVIEAARGLAAGPTSLPLDFMTPRTPAAWAAELEARRIDAVVNGVGILMASPGASFERLHRDGPIELFEGAALAGVRRVVQVSALGIGAPGRASPYLESKRAADEALLGLGVDGAVVRPSLLFGPGSRSAALFATLAGLPVIGLPGRGAQRVQPIHVFEVAECIVGLVERSGSARGVYELGGAQVLDYRAMLSAYRAAQGLGEAIWIRMPRGLMHASALLAERLPQRVFCRDTLRLLERGNVTARNAAPTLLGRTPSGLADGLAVTPPVAAFTTRVALAGPVEAAMRAALGFLWLYTAAISALLPERSGVLELLARCGFTGAAGHAALFASCALNVALGLLTLARPSVRLYAVQAAAVAGYTLTAAIGVPELTLDHCGPLVKNLPVLMCVAALWFAEASRPAPAAAAQTSMLATRRALLSMKARRGSTSSPISMVKTRSASIASSS